MMRALSLIFIVLVPLTGCTTAKRPMPWAPPLYAQPTASAAALANVASLDGDVGAIKQVKMSFTKQPHRDQALTLAETHYALAVRAEAEEAHQSVDLFYQAAAYAYFHLFGPGPCLTDLKADERMREVYQSSVARLIHNGQRFDRLDAKKQLVVDTGDGPRAIPVVHHLGGWQPDDVDRLVVVGDYAPEEISHRYGRTGFGVPLVGVRYRRGDGSPRDEFLFKKQPFAATAVLHPDLDSLVGKQNVVTASMKEASAARLELHDPARTATLKIGGHDEPLAADLSAPLQFCVDSARRLRLDILGFRRPGQVARLTGLYLLEPYQRGKIPVVFVHGLLSDAHTWDEMVNELRADPEIRARFQFAVYFYPTGNPFLVSAGRLRKELGDLQKLNDPNDPDPALEEMVLVGHSMGGVLSRFQVTRSEDKVWKLVARRPFEELHASPTTRALLQNALFFEPQPSVKRVVFIGTPHRGSTLARNFVGRLGASLVTPPADIQEARSQLLADNPDAFNPAFAKHLPTSVEELASGSPILDVMQRLEFNPQVRLHSIIGRGKLFPVLQPGDGYVPVSSARLDGAESVLYVEAGHTNLHRDPESIREVKRILRKHVQELGDGELRASRRKPDVFAHEGQH